MSPLSKAYAHQRITNLPKDSRTISTSGNPAPVVEPVGEPLQHSTSVCDWQAVYQIQHQDGQRIGQPVGRQFGRRAHCRLGGGRSDAP